MDTFYYRIRLWILDAGWPTFELVRITELLKVELEFRALVVNYVQRSGIPAQPRAIEELGYCCRRFV